MSTVLLKDRRQIPALKLAQAADHCACAVAAKVVHDEQRVCRWVKENMQAFEHGFFGDRLPRRPSADVVAEMDELDALVLKPRAQ